MSCAHADMQIVVLTAFADDALVAACLAEGVRRACCSRTPPRRSCSRNWSGSGAARGVVDPRLAAPAPTDITPREHDVLRLVARGMTSAQIAAELHLTVNTVRSYVQSILTKLGAHTRIEALAEATPAAADLSARHYGRETSARAFGERRRPSLASSVNCSMRSIVCSSRRPDGRSMSRARTASSLRPGRPAAAAAIRRA